MIANCSCFEKHAQNFLDIIIANINDDSLQKTIIKLLCEYYQTLPLSSIIVFLKETRGDKSRICIFFEISHFIWNF